MSTPTHPLRNQLWLARQNIGLQRKEVAYLLHHRTTDQISRYENGRRLPSLRLLLEMEYLYGLPPRLLFSDYYRQLAQMIRERAASNPALRAQLKPVSGEYCSFMALLHKGQLNAEEQTAFKNHTIHLLHSTPFQQIIPSE